MIYLYFNLHKLFYSKKGVVMFHFLNEINEQLELPITSVLSSYEVVNLGGKVVYVQGYKDILNFEKEHIVLKLKEGELHIKGQNLNIRDLNVNSILIEGTIRLIEEVGA
jgi:sporulation protein YqfC